MPVTGEPRTYAVILYTIHIFYIKRIKRRELHRAQKSSQENQTQVFLGSGPKVSCWMDGVVEVVGPIKINDGKRKRKVCACACSWLVICVRRGGEK